MPSPVDHYFREVKEGNPSYSDEQAWATAWSIYCKHKNPGSKHCHKDADEYLTKSASEDTGTNTNRALVARYLRACGGSCGCGGTCGKSCGCDCHGPQESVASRVAARFQRAITEPVR